jgi:hypothetical protein
MLMVAEQVKKFLLYIEPKGSLLCSQQPATDPYPELDETIQVIPQTSIKFKAVCNIL